jgi:hypothetical protein
MLQVGATGIQEEEKKKKKKKAGGICKNHYVYLMETLP